MPVLRKPNMLRARRDAVNDCDDVIALGDGEGAASAEIVLDIDNGEQIVWAGLHGALQEIELLKSTAPCPPTARAQLRCGCSHAVNSSAGAGADRYIARLDVDDRVKRISGIGCNPAVILATRAELLTRVGKALAEGLLPFPEKNGPVTWPRFSLDQLLLA